MKDKPSCGVYAQRSSKEACDVTDQRLHRRPFWIATRGENISRFLWLNRGFKTVDLEILIFFLRIQFNYVLFMLIFDDEAL